MTWTVADLLGNLVFLDLVPQEIVHVLKAVILPSPQCFLRIHSSQKEDHKENLFTEKIYIQSHNHPNYWPICL